MALFIFNYVLPALLAYTLFVGIAGKLNPIRKPEHLEERPSWMLGLWTSMSVFLVLSVGLHMAYGMTLESVSTLATPGAASVTVLLGIGFIGYLRYKKLVLAELDANDIDEEDEQTINWFEKVLQLDAIIADEPQISPHDSELNKVTLSQYGVKTEHEAESGSENPAFLSEQALLESYSFDLNLDDYNSDTSDSTLTNVETEQEPPLDSLAMNDRFHPDQLEINVANLKRELVKAKHELRMQIAARAKALSTANKAVAFARQSIDLRARMETELATARTALSDRQNTITALMDRLDKDKRLSDEEIAALAWHVSANDATNAMENASPSAFGMEAQANDQFTHRS